jgi:hypothetical protein
MNRFNFKEELQRNVEAIHKFYNEVATCLIEKLLKEQRFRKNIT